MRRAGYIICTAPRSGSTLLCRMLEATGQAGAPDSHFHEPSLDAWLADHGLSERVFSDRRAALQAVIDAALATGRGGTDIFGLRLQRHSFDFLMGQIALLHPGARSDRARLRAVFGEVLFIHLSRRDRLAQAISFVTAEQSGLWHRAPDGRELERLAPPRAPVYDREAIAAARDRLAGFDRAWRDWFAREGIAPLTLVYEDLAADPPAAVARVLDALGLPAAPAINGALPTAKLADARSAAWAERFRRETGEAG